MSEALPADLAPARLRAGLTTASLGRSLEVHAVVDSTMDVARAAAEAGAPDGHLVLADAQRAGRGRRGAPWLSPPGSDLYLTLVLRRLPPTSELPLLGLAAALAVCETADALEVGPATVKWPNDVLIGGRKAAGILTEAYQGEDGDPVVLLGVGIDVGRRTWPEALREVATSFAEAKGEAVERAEVLLAWLPRLERWRERLRSAIGRAELLAALQDRLAWLGQTVRCDEVEGRLLGLDERGSVRLRTPTGIRTLHAGTLRRID